MPDTRSTIVESPLGPIEVRVRNNQVTSIRIGAPDSVITDDTPLLREARVQLAAWFEGKLRTFDLPLEPLTSPRGELLRMAIAAIPYGESLSYGVVARTIGSGPRAVGQACRRNPFPIVIPCHRVIGSAGSIGYYSGGDGIATKLWLLNHESKQAKGSKWAG
jgi:methylated-DNA-[protein]-cysteine S-methyltransferase